LERERAERLLSAELPEVHVRARFGFAP